jgi:uncharacterized protein YdbL (DUF1318 family)
MSYNPQQPPSSQSSEQQPGSGYYNPNASIQNENVNQNLPPNIQPPQPLVSGIGHSAQVNRPVAGLTAKRAQTLNPVLLIGGGVVLLGVVLFVVFGLVIKPASNNSTTTTAVVGANTVTGTSMSTGSAAAPTLGKTTLTGKVGETLRLDDYAVTVHSVKWGDIPSNFAVKINGETRLAKATEGVVAIEFSIQRVSSTGLASRESYGVSTSAQYSLVDGAGKQYEGYGHPNANYPDIKYRDNLAVGETARGWLSYAAPKALASDTGFTFIIQTKRYNMSVNRSASGGVSMAYEPFYFKVNLAQN